MLISKKNNKGFSLVEVIVSMLVLSIVISSVLTAFSLSAKSNAKTQKAQSAESLMEDLQELAGAVRDSSKYADSCVSFLPMGAYKTVTQALSATETVEKTTISNVKKGSYTYSVDITIDTKPTEYTGVNTTDVLSFGESDKAAILIDASTNGNCLPGYTENTHDEMAVNYFLTLRNNKIMDDNALLEEDETPTPLLDPDDPTDKGTIRALIDRDVYLEAVETPTGKVQLTGYFSYELTGDDDTFDIGGASRVWEDPFFPAQEFSKPGTGTTGDQELGKIYLLFSPFTSENRTAAGNYDVRIWDDTQQLLDTDIFIVYQESSVQSIDPSSPGGATLLGQSLEQRFPSSDATKAVDVSFAKRGASEKPPKRVDLYSPSIVSCGSFASVNTHSNRMISESQEIRVHTITIEIKDSDGVTLASNTITSLQ